MTHDPNTGFDKLQKKMVRGDKPQRFLARHGTIVP